MPKLNDLKVSTDITFVMLVKTSKVRLSIPEITDLMRDFVKVFGRSYDKAPTVSQIRRIVNKMVDAGILSTDGRKYCVTGSYIAHVNFMVRNRTN